MKEITFLVLLIVNVQDSDNFQTRERASYTLEKIGYVYDIRPELQLTIKNKKQSLEVRRRSQVILDNLIELYLKRMYYYQPPGMPLDITYVLESKPGIVYHTYEQAYCELSIFQNKYDPSLIKKIVKPVSVKQYVQEKQNDGLSSEDILKELESKLKNETSSKFRRSIIDFTQTYWESRFKNISDNARRIYPNLFPPRVR